jgi:hypothetical protein
VREYRYHVVYYVGNVVGSITVKIDTEIETEEAVKQVSDYISADFCGGKEIILINWIKLKRDTKASLKL